MTGTLLAAALFGVPVPAAEAHGPCDCLYPVMTSPGATVRVTSDTYTAPGEPGYPAYRIVLNPRPSQLGIAPSYLTSAYRADAPSPTVLSRPRRKPTRRAKFRVPVRTPPGIYLVLIFDGDEGGAHNTWAYLHVIDVDSDNTSSGIVAENATADNASVSPAEPAAERSTWWVATLTGAAGIAAGLLVGRRRRLPPSRSAESEP